MAKQKMHYAWRIVICCSALTLGSTGILYDCSGIFLNPVRREFGVGMSDISFYLTISLLTRVFILPFVGSFIKRFNLRTLICVTVALQCVTFGAMSTFTSVYHYYAAGIVFGITGSITIFMFVPLIINNWFKDKEGFAIGIAMTFSGVGSIIFQPVGSSLIGIIGWRYTYIALAAFAAVITLPLLILVLREKPSDMGLEPYSAENKEPSRMEIEQTAEPEGMTAKAALKSPMFYIVVAATICISYIGSMCYHTASFAVSTGLAVSLSGFVSAASSLGLIVGKPILGYLNDMLGVVKSTFIYAILGILGLGLLIASYSNQKMVFVGIFVLGISMSLLTVEVLLIVKHVFGSKDYSVIYSYVMTVSSLSMAAGATFNGRILDVSGSYIPAFYIMIALNLILAASIMLVGKKSRIISPTV